jgi:hypothetical protein
VSHSLSAICTVNPLFHDHRSFLYTLAIFPRVFRAKSPLGQVLLVAVNKQMSSYEIAQACEVHSPSTIDDDNDSLLNRRLFNKLLTTSNIYLTDKQIPKRSMSEVIVRCIALLYRFAHSPLCSSRHPISVPCP